VRLPVETQVPPAGIERFEQRHLHFTPPRFDLFFTLSGVVNSSMLLEVDQAIQTVLAEKTWDKLVPVLVRAPLNVIDDSKV
jgi:hypothetical protein